MCTRFHVPRIFYRALGIFSFRLSSDREILQCLYSDWSRSQRLLQFFLPFQTHRVADILESLYSDWPNVAEVFAIRLFHLVNIPELFEFAD